MRNKAIPIHRLTQGLLLAAVCVVALGFAGCDKPKPPPPPPPPPEPVLKPGALLSDLEIVKVRLETEGEEYGDDYPTAKTAVEPGVEVAVDLNFNPPANEPAIIFFFTEGEGPAPGQPNAVRWEFAGLAEGHTVHITPKDGQSTTIFDFPDSYNGEPAFSLSPPNDTIYSGPANKETFQQLFEAAQANFSEGETTYVSWFYDVDVVDAKGNVVASYDPEVRVKKYP